MGAVPLLMFDLLAPWALAQDSREVALIGRRGREVSFWEGCALSSVPFSSRTITAEYCHLSLDPNLIICKSDTSFEIS